MVLFDPTDGSVLGEQQFNRNLGEVIYETDYYCLAKDTPLLILNKEENHLIKFVQEIVDGDRILSLNKDGSQQWKKVKLTERIAPNKLLEFHSGALFQVTNNHKLFRPNFEIDAAGNLRQNDCLMAVKRILLTEEKTDICISDFITEDWLLKEEGKVGHYSRHNTNEKVFVNNKIPLNYEFGIIVGLYLAEGSTAKNIVQFALHLEEENVSSLLEEYVEKIFGFSATTNVFPEYTRRIVYLFNKTLSSFFEIAIPGSSYTKELPPWAFSAPNSFKLGLIHGWLIGDGSFNKNRVWGTTASKKLAYGIHNLSLSLGIKTTISISKNKEIDIFKIKFTGRSNLELLCSVQINWKHYISIKNYLSLEDTKKGFTRNQLKELFFNYYKDGMSKEEFLSVASLAWSPFKRIWGSWSALLKDFGKEKFLKRHDVSRTELILIGHKWLKDNVFSESKWIADKNVPGINAIIKYFGKSSTFVKYVLSLSADDVQKLNYKNEFKDISSVPIYRIYEKDYDYKFVYDLEVEGNENFLIGNIVSHNSGSQINILMGDVLLDSAVSISFGVSQEKAPVWGYANQYYAFTTDGHVLVQGSLAVAFKETGYLFWPAQRYQEKMQFLFNLKGVGQDYLNEQISKNNAWTSPRYNYSGGKVVNSYKPGDYSLLEASKAGSNQAKKKTMRINVEQMVALMNNKDSTNSDVHRQYNQFWQELGSMSDNDFENWADVFEDVLWYGSDPANAATRDKLFSKNLRIDASISDEDVLGHRRLDQYPPVDIWITYGDCNSAAANHTVKKILDVSFVGQSQTIEVSGQPILEVYSFFARNLV